MRTVLGAVLAVLAAGAARAEVVAVAENGFEIKQVAEVKAPAGKVYEALIQVGSWWDSSHSWSGEAENLTIEAKPGGCWCERLPNGGAAKHLEVVATDPGKSLRFAGGLGPLQFTGASGHLNWTLAEKDGVTTVTGPTRSAATPRKGSRPGPRLSTAC